MKYDISQRRINRNIKKTDLATAVYLLIGFILLMIGGAYKDILWSNIGLLYLILGIILYIESRYQCMKDIILNLDEMYKKKQELDDEFYINKET